MGPFFLRVIRMYERPCMKGTKATYSGRNDDNTKTKAMHERYLLCRLRVGWLGEAYVYPPEKFRRISNTVGAVS